MNADEVKAAWREASPILYVTAAVITFAGTGALSGLAAAVLRPQPADADTVITVAKAFYATWPMSIALAVIVIGLQAGAIQKFGGVQTLFGCGAILALALYVATQGAQVATLGGPSQTTQAIVDTLKDFLALYGPTVFLGGFAAGAGVGAFAFHFSAVLNKPPKEAVRP